MLLLHGIPGHEKSLDLAVDLRARGIHCLHIHYRGSWGSDGDYSMAHLVPDARVALQWLAGQPCVDPARIALVGISLGGWVALTLAGGSDSVCAVAALSPLLDPEERPLSQEVAADYAASLHGTNAERLRGEWAALPPFTSFALRLAHTPVLLVTAGADLTFPPEHYANLPAGLERLTHVRFPRADHVYSDVRPGLRHVVCQWLVDRFDPGPGAEGQPRRDRTV